MLYPRESVRANMITGVKKAERENRPRTAEKGLCVGVPLHTQLHTHLLGLYPPSCGPRAELSVWPFPPHPTFLPFATVHNEPSSLSAAYQSDDPLGQSARRANVPSARLCLYPSTARCARGGQSARRRSESESTRSKGKTKTCRHVQGRVR